jgi:DNA-binding GntR family transcriptional regulator
VLAAEGLVTMKVRRGAYVTEVSANQDLADVYHLLSLLESDAAGSGGRPKPLTAELAELQRPCTKR